MAMEKQNADELKARIAELPSGYISRKKINGKVRLYYQWTEDGKKRSKYLSDDAAAETARLIEERRTLQEQLKVVRASEPKVKVPASAAHIFQNLVMTGTALQNYVQPVMGFRQRDCIKVLDEYLHNDISGKVCGPPLHSPDCDTRRRKRWLGNCFRMHLFRAYLLLTGPGFLTGF